MLASGADSGNERFFGVIQHVKFLVRRGLYAEIQIYVVAEHCHYAVMNVVFRLISKLPLQPASALDSYT